jgi:hypothetical protein
MNASGLRKANAVDFLQSFCRLHAQQHRMDGHATGSVLLARDVILAV